MPTLLYNHKMRKNSAHHPITQEMIEDLSLMGDQDFMEKWNVSRQYPIRARKRLGIKSFNNMHGTKEHRFENGVEYKWCQKEHWERIENFTKMSSRRDGLRGWCKEHSREEGRKSYHRANGKEKAQAWRKTPNGKKVLRNTWRKQTAIKNSAYVSWTRIDEMIAFDTFGGRCGYCGIALNFLTLEFDHFIPIALGGKTEPKNMIPCCSLCNHGVGGKFDQEPEMWIYKRFNGNAKEILNDIKKKLAL